MHPTDRSSHALLSSPNAVVVAQSALGIDLRLSVDSFLEAINGQVAAHHAMGSAPSRRQIACDLPWLQGAPATIIVNRAEHYLPHLAETAAHVADLLCLGPEQLHLRAHCSAWPDSFGMHYDPHENLVCQAAGHKLCHYSREPVRGAWTAKGSTLAPAALPGSLQQLPREDLVAGQALFMPGGTWHKFSAQGASLAFSFAWNPRLPLKRPEPAVRVVWHRSPSGRCH